jgi:hypothetical protein
MGDGIHLLHLFAVRKLSGFKKGLDGTSGSVASQSASNPN